MPDAGATKYYVPCQTPVCLPASCFPAVTVTITWSRQMPRIGISHTMPPWVGHADNITKPQTRVKPSRLYAQSEVYMYVGEGETPIHLQR